ncbi:glycosyltransferase [Erysipelotrichaceae bacterium AF15-26LB]|nr:glycosyltransferase [[Clostridium] innocuum]RJV83493.1 glycosyltransferase [Erysipelotrichaceae bacterium AF15-26LB]RJV84842.1 glycosyltransferase [Erysipelotrichaceae bacterium AF19-24AC]
MKDYILIITMHADPAMAPGYNEWGGTHVYMKELLDSFGERNIPCIMITRKSMQFLQTEEQYNRSCKVIRLIDHDEDQMSKLKLYEYHAEYLAKINEIIKKEGVPKIIHSVYWNSGRLALKLSKQWQIPFVHSVISNSKGRVSRGAYEPMPQRASYEYKIYHEAYKILCVSEDEKNDLIHFYDVKPDKLIVCGQYIHKAFLTPSHDMNGFPALNSHLTDDQQHAIAEKYNQSLHHEEGIDPFWVYKAFTYYGRMDFNKGIPEIVKAWYIVLKKHNENCPPLWMIGGSLSEINTIRKELKKSIPDLPMLEKEYKIVWWGYLNQEGVSTILLKTLVIIMHSLYEPGGRVAVEAMCEGIPVIATPNGFARDTIKDWENGFLVNHGDINKLALKMEYFIRQPLLSNSLGMNALQYGHKVITSWKFIENHLQAYGYEVDKTDMNTSYVNHYKHRDINLYPYNSYPLTDDYYIRSFKKSCGMKATSICEIHPDICTSECKCITADNKEYIAKRVITRLSTSPIYNPFATDAYVRNAQTQFTIEKNIYLRMPNSFLCGYDDFHHILFTDRLDHLHEENTWVSIKSRMTYLITRPNLLTEYEKNVYRTYMEKNMHSFEEIKVLLKSLTDELPLLYFECSGLFFNKLSWSIAYYLMEYNKDYIEQRDYQSLMSFIDFFNTFDYQLDTAYIRDINLDIEYRHFRLRQQAIQLIDHEKTSIGKVETDIASLLYDETRVGSTPFISDLWEKAKEIIRAYSLNETDVLSSIAYRVFYDCIIACVLHDELPNKYIAALHEVKAILQES